MCVCVYKRERERDKVRVCVYEREREREGEIFSEHESRGGGFFHVLFSLIEKENHSVQDLQSGRNINSDQPKNKR